MRIPSQSFRPVVGLLGLFFLGLAAWSIPRKLELVRNSDRLPGVVVELSKYRKGAWHPVVEYRDPRGEPRRFRSRGGSTPPDYRVGDSVFVRSHRSEPGRDEIDSFYTLWLGPLLAGLAGLICAGVGLIHLLSRRAAPSA